MARILVIDDDEAVRSVLTILLGQRNHEVVTAKDGRQGLKAFESDHFDLLIVDLFMPEIDGLETIRLVRKGKLGLPIIVISGSRNRASMPDFLAMAMKLGAIESIPKPFRPNELFEVVEKCLRPGGDGKTAPSS